MRKFVYIFIGICLILTLLSFELRAENIIVENDNHVLVTRYNNKIPYSDFFGIEKQIPLNVQVDGKQAVVPAVTVKDDSEDLTQEKGN